jgi:hypothetical protein
LSAFPALFFNLFYLLVIIRASLFQCLKSLVLSTPIFRDALYKGDRYDGWVYYPHPETKLRHFQNPSVLEVIAMPIADLVYGEFLQLLINSQKISLHL